MANGRTNTHIEPADVEFALLYISQLTRGMGRGIFKADYAEGVLDTLPQFKQERTGNYSTVEEQGRNALEWVLNNYEAVAGALGLIAITTDIMTRALMDNELSVNEQDNDPTRA